MSLFIGIESTSLSENDIARLKNKQVAGVILFIRNYENFEQLKNLCTEISEIAPNLPIGVDCEGGRVQRFRGGVFSDLPAAAKFDELFDRRPQTACLAAYAAGLVCAYELAAVGIDFSFAPVLDLRDEKSSVIGDRAFHQDAAVVSLLSTAWRRGAREFQMPSVGKHYPGHGRIFGDSHTMLPKDSRSYGARQADRLPFYAAAYDGIEAIMAAHILLPEDTRPSGFSAKCLQSLRDFGFDGAIFSDDLDMQAAKELFPDAAVRSQHALSAGADAAMICNSFQDMDIALASNLLCREPEKSQKRIQKLSRNKTIVHTTESREKYLFARKRLAPLL